MFDLVNLQKDILKGNNNKSYQKLFDEILPAILVLMFFEYKEESKSFRKIFNTEEELLILFPGLAYRIKHQGIRMAELILFLEDKTANMKVYKDYNLRADQEILELRETKSSDLYEFITSVIEGKLRELFEQEYTLATFMQREGQYKDIDNPKVDPSIKICKLCGCQIYGDYVDVDGLGLVCDICNEE